jgi:hypothetical protein
MMANGSVNLHQAPYERADYYSNDGGQGAGRELKRYLIGSSMNGTLKLAVQTLNNQISSGKRRLDSHLVMLEEVKLRLETLLLIT